MPYWASLGIFIKMVFHIYILYMAIIQISTKKARKVNDINKKTNHIGIIDKRI